MNPIGSLHSSHSSIAPASSRDIASRIFASRTGLAVVQPELGGERLFLGGLVHRVPADAVAVAIHRELDGGVRVVGETVELRLQASPQLVGLLRSQHGSSLRTSTRTVNERRRAVSELFHPRGMRARCPRFRATAPRFAAPPGAIPRLTKWIDTGPRSFDTGAA